jgi:hypothetical protein
LRLPSRFSALKFEIVNANLAPVSLAHVVQPQLRQPGRTVAMLTQPTKCRHMYLITAAGRAAPASLKAMTVRLSGAAFVGLPAQGRAGRS